MAEPALLGEVEADAIKARSKQGRGLHCLAMHKQAAPCSLTKSVSHPRRGARLNYTPVAPLLLA